LHRNIVSLNITLTGNLSPRHKGFALMRVPRAIRPAPYLLLILSGCGLADYENRIDKQRTRLSVYDEESKYLGAMLELPPSPKRNAPGPFPFDVFVRLPRGIAGTTAEKNGTYLINSQFIFRYLGNDGQNVFLTAALAAPPDEPTNMERGEWTPEDFRSSFELALGTIIKGFPPARETFEHHVRPPTTGPQLPDLIFDESTFEDGPGRKDGTYVAVYTHQRRGRLIAMAFQVPQARKNDIAVQRGIDLCLRSLDISENAAAKRTAYATYKRLD
jgi:hypothetical protein